jgi:hypothetical protein
MRKFALLLAGISLPVLTFALDYHDATSQYGDAPFSKPEAAAISVLTNLGAIGGNPDGKFHPERTINRAEFLKMLYLSNNTLTAASADAASCFPDVSKEAWFSRYVCLAKKRDAVKGYPDGLFHPERSVNYVEALKMTAELFSYGSVSSGTHEAWYMPYVRDAESRGLLLPLSLSYDAFLTRGQVARLIASFRAFSDGELAQYRALEKGKMLSSSSMASSVSNSSLSSSSSSSSVSSVASSSLSSSSSSVSRVPLLPVTSHFLMLGERTQPIVGIKVFADKEAVFMRSVKVTLDRKVESFDILFLVDEAGTQIGQITLDHVYDNTDKTWRGFFTDSTYRIPKGQEVVLAVEARMKERNKGGVSGELVKPQLLEITVQGEDSGSSYTTNTYNSVPPQHQTTQGKIVSVANALSETDSLPVGTNQLLAGFTFTGSHVADTSLRLRELEFQISKSSSVSVRNWQLGTNDSSDRVLCTVNDQVVTCSTISPELGTLTSGPRTLRLFGDVTLEPGASQYFLQVSLNQPGTIGQNGAIRWNDGSSDFVWTELTAPIARSTRFQ